MAASERTHDLAVLGQIGCLKLAEVRVHQLFFGEGVSGGSFLDVSDPASDTFVLFVGPRVADSSVWRRRDDLNDTPRWNYARHRVAGQVLVDREREYPVRGNPAATALVHFLSAVENVDGRAEVTGG